VIIRLVHLAAIGALISSAFYAYTVKYETTWEAEQLIKLKSKVQREKDAIAILRAEWQLLNRPERLQELSRQYPDLAPLQAHQLGTIAELPMRGEKGDALGKKLDLMGLASPTATPTETTGSITAPRAGAGRTPAR
jgi:hypothetical protein